MDKFLPGRDRKNKSPVNPPLSVLSVPSMGYVLKLRRSKIF